MLPHPLSTRSTDDLVRRRDELVEKLSLFSGVYRDAASSFYGAQVEMIEAEIERRNSSNEKD